MSVNRAALPAPLYTAEQTRVLDRTAIEQFSIPGIRLMQRAGHAVFAEILERFPGIRHLTILCGGGNNGGDGFVVARLARQRNLRVQVICVGGERFAERLQGEALQAWQELEAAAPGFECYHPGVELKGELLVDALLGTGLTGDVRGDYATLIRQINASHKPVFAVDIPSGLCADSGRILGCAVRARFTLSFIGLKRGLFTAQAVDCCGQILFDDLKVPDEVYDPIPVSAFRTTDEDLRECMPPRSRNSHKGRFGHLLVVGGNRGMGGAALLTAEAALRSGAGLVSLATRQEHVAASLCRCPEVMVHAVESGGQLPDLLEKADVIVIGPGLGQNAWAEQMLRAVLAAKKPLLVDADGLNLLCANGGFPFSGPERTIVTPHPGEAARILNCSVAELEADRFAAVERLQRRCGGAVVLKGAGSLVNAGEVSFLCDAGNPGMSVGGMGDLLSGICGALLAQGLSPEDAARIGVYIHATAADRVAAKRGEIGMLPSDLLVEIPGVINKVYE